VGDEPPSAGSSSQKCSRERQLGVRGLLGDDSVDEGVDAGLSMGENADRGISGDRQVTGGDGMGNRHAGRDGSGTVSNGRGRRRARDGV